MDHLRQFTTPIRPVQSLILISTLLSSFAIADTIRISTQADFDKHCQTQLSPGDSVLFERGKSFDGMFSPRAVGKAGKVITIATFGHGPRPVINNHGKLHPHPTRKGETVSAGLFLFNAEYTEVRGLEITNNNGGEQSEDLFGIYVLGEDTGKYHRHIYIEDNYVHHVNGAVAGKRRGGIHVHGRSPRTSTPATYHNLRIVNNVVEQIGGVGIATAIDDVVNASEFEGIRRENAIAHLYVAHNKISNTGRNTVILRDADYGICEFNTSANSSRHDTGHSFFNFRTLGMTFQYNEAYGNVGEPGDIDRGGFDADYHSKDTLFQYNYSHDNNWFMGIMKRANNGVIIRYNLSVNERLGAYFYGFEKSTLAKRIQIYNNTHVFGTGFKPAILAGARTPHESSFRNNVFYANDSGTMGSNAENGKNVRFDSNAYHQIEPPATDANAQVSDLRLKTAESRIARKAPAGIDMQKGRDALAGYRLGAESSSRGRGCSIRANGGFDFWGHRLPDSDIDMGAGQSGEIRSPVTVATGDFFPIERAGLSILPDGKTVVGGPGAKSFAQTFQMDAELDLKSIYFDYEFGSAARVIPVNIALFEVKDVFAETVEAGKPIFSAPAVMVPAKSVRSEAVMVLDSAVALSKTSGTTGYCLQISGGGNLGFQWRRSGRKARSVCLGGQAYRNGSAIQRGERDFVLAIGAESTD